MTNKKLIALDLDGTLLNSHRQISSKNMAALERAKAAGIPVVLCSGRYHPGVKLIADMAGTEDLLICGNGAQITTASGKDVFSRYISLEETRHLADVAMKMHLAFSVYADNTIYSAWNHGVLKYYAQSNCPAVLADTPFPTQVTKNSRILKIEIHGMFDHAQGEALRHEIESMGNIVGEGDYASSVECHAGGVSKGTGLAEAAAYYGVPLENTLAVGNAENDVPMLLCAGHAVAVANAVAELKAVAHRIVAHHDENGVAEAINWYMGLCTGRKTP